MIKHDNENYWDCSCRRYGDKPTNVSYPDDDCEPLHYRHVKLINDIQQIIEHAPAVLHLDDAAQYIIDQLKRSLKDVEQ